VEVRLNSEVIMGEDVEKVTLPFDEAGENDPDCAPAADGALALLPADTPAVPATEGALRLADYAQAWGIMIPADFTPATKAQVAYWQELCGAISLSGVDGMRDGNWPADLVPRSQPCRRWQIEGSLSVVNGPGI
jgi:hypothetical protein